MLSTVLSDLLSDDSFLEETAKLSYYRERAEDVARDREHETSDEYDYLCISWEDLSDHAKRPYRTAVTTMADALLVAV